MITLLTLLTIVTAIVAAIFILSGVLVALGISSTAIFILLSDVFAAVFILWAIVHLITRKK